MGEDVGQLTRLPQREPVRLDAGRLCALYDHLGSGQADRLIGRATEDIALHLYRAQAAYHTGAHDRLTRSAGAVAFVAAQIGLTALERIAGSVCQCCASGDAVALGATFSRLMRAGEQALEHFWDMQAPAR